MPSLDDAGTSGGGKPLSDMAVVPSSVGITPHDRVSLAVGVTIETHGLTDHLSARDYPLNRVGQEVVESLDGKSPLSEGVAAIAERYEVEPDVIWNDVSQLLAILDTYALLEVRRNIRSRARALWWKALTMLQMGQFVPFVMLDWTVSGKRPTRRYLAGFSSLVLACIRAHLIFYGSFLGISVLLLLALMLIEPGSSSNTLLMVSASMLRPLFVVAVFLLLVVLHEYGHLAVMRLTGVAPHYIFVRGLTVGIAHRDALPWQRRLVSVAGPLCAFAGGAVLAYFIATYAIGWYGVHRVDAFFPLALAGIHLLSLGPWASDGRLLWRRADRLRLVDATARPALLQ